MEHPSGFIVDHNRIHPGSGQATFDVAKQALCEWQDYRSDWIELHQPDVDPEPDQTVGVLDRAVLWCVTEFDKPKVGSRFLRLECFVKGALDTRELVCRIEFHYTPKHGSWLNIAENESMSTQHNVG